ncbi:MAG: T9SS type A sorting domain-containing protein [Bacteroidetes bacterium]|nr:T9SS type A sorting domain-containing protein [Bacteroidota bacterium]
MMKRNITLFLSIIGIISFVGIKAQIVYTDIPDTTINYPTIEYLGSGTNILNIDLNNDSIPDFYFYLEKWQEWVTPSAQPVYTVSEIKSSHQENNICIVEFSTAPCTYVFTENDTIDSNCAWNLQYDFSVIGVSVEGFAVSCDLPFQDKYYGLSFNIDNNIHYGWLQIDVNEDGEIILKGYAYNTIPNEPITAGQVEPNSIHDKGYENPIIIYTKNKTLLIKQLSNHELIRQVIIYNLSGVEVLRYKIEDYQTTIDLNKVNPRNYIVKVISDKNVYSKILFIN